MTDLYTDTLADLNTILKAMLQPSAHLGFVAQGELPTNYSAGNKFLNFRRRRVAKTRIIAPRLLLPNLYMSGQNEAGTGAVAIVKGGFEQNGQTVMPTWSGLSSGSIVDASYLASDPASSVDIAAGSVYYERGYCQYPNGMPYWSLQSGSAQNSSGGDCFEYGASALTDRTALTGTFSSSDGSNLFATLGTVALTTAPSLFWLGDSTFSGVGDAIDDDSGMVGLTRVLAQFFGGFNAGVGSATSAAFIAATRTVRTALANTYGTHLIQGHTVNMLGNTLASMKADLASERALFPGLRAYMTTCLPSGSTSDSGATVGNQTPSANESKRTGINDWKRLCPEGWDGCIDIADQIEVNSSGVKTRNGGRFPAGMSNDMLHPNAAGYLLAKIAGGHLRSPLVA